MGASIRSRVHKAVSNQCKGLAVVVLPGSLNPVHSEHIHSLSVAKAHLEQGGMALVGGFLQPSSDFYVTDKVGPDCAMRLADRIVACELAASTAKDHDDEPWIHAWRSGQTNGFAVPQAIESFLNNIFSQEFGQQLQ